MTRKTYGIICERKEADSVIESSDRIVYVNRNFRIYMEKISE